MGILKIHILEPSPHFLLYNKTGSFVAPSLLRVYRANRWECSNSSEKEVDYVKTGLGDVGGYVPEQRFQEMYETGSRHDCEISSEPLAFSPGWCAFGLPLR